MLVRNAQNEHELMLPPKELVSPFLVWREGICVLCVLYP